MAQSNDPIARALEAERAMTNPKQSSTFRKYRNRETGEVIEATLTTLYIVDDNDATTGKGNQIVLGKIGAVIKIKGDSQADVYWKCYTFNNQYQLIE